jgi:hypothetical protein
MGNASSSSYSATPSRSAEAISASIGVAVVFVTGFLAEMVLNASTDKTVRLQTILNYTASSDENNVVIRQNPKYPDAYPLGLSVNEITGPEFAYSFFLFVSPTTFTGDDVLKHVFHKGYTVPWPLMGPAVFIRGNTNVMRVVMNTFKNPYTYTDIQNIPVQKWFHVVLNCFKGGLDIYINGTLANRIPFTETVPYQNFQDIIFFSQPTFTFRDTEVAALPTGQIVTIQGAFSGFLSSFTYARYALSMSEITGLMNKGPSSTMKNAQKPLPPYLADSWWTNQQSGK